MTDIKGKYGKDCKLFIDNPESEILGFLYKFLESKASEDSKVRIMPDTHFGAGCIIGFTSTLGKYINPQYLGVDLGCGVTSYISKTTIPESPRLDLIDYKIRNLVPTGMEIHKRPVVDEKDFFKFLRQEYSKARSAWPDIIPDIGEINEKFIKKMLIRLGMDQGVFYKSLGTLGGGNHFIEVSKTPQNNWAITVHTGSRNFGIKVWKYWTKFSNQPEIDISKREKDLQELRRNFTGKDLEYRIKKLMLSHEYDLKIQNGFLHGSGLSGYLSDLCIAQAYASYNRNLIIKRVTDILHWKKDIIIESIHNYVNWTDRIIRKGAISSYSGDTIIIPLNMADGILICTGKSESDWNYSAPHGSGRKFSRSSAKENINMSEYTKRMEGIYSTSVCQETIDESPMAYKDSDFIEKSITDTVDVKYKLLPVINIKSTNILDRNEKD